jgi:hypothetical protein
VTLAVWVVLVHVARLKLSRTFVAVVRLNAASPNPTQHRCYLVG